MVETYAELYLHTRQRLMEAETQEAAGPMARDIISTLLGLSQETFLAEKDSPVSEMQCTAT